MKKPKTLPFLKMSPVMWPELESNQRHKDFQTWKALVAKRLA
ncbi:MAG: hypothetical protein WCF19_01425 [Chlamydiales bacterium]